VALERNPHPAYLPNKRSDDFGESSLNNDLPEGAHLPYSTDLNDHIRLIHWTANRVHARYSPNFMIERDEVVSMVYIQMAALMESYDPALGTFSKYAVWAADRSVSRTIKEESETRVHYGRNKKAGDEGVPRVILVDFNDTDSPLVQEILEMSDTEEYNTTHLDDLTFEILQQDDGLEGAIALMADQLREHVEHHGSASKVEEQFGLKKGLVRSCLRGTNGDLAEFTQTKARNLRAVLNTINDG